jgi:hypothetical protein
MLSRSGITAVELIGRDPHCQTVTSFVFVRLRRLHERAPTPKCRGEGANAPWSNGCFEL